MRVAYVVQYPLQGAVGQRVHSVARALVAGEHVDSVHLVSPGCSLTLPPDQAVFFVPTPAGYEEGGSVLAKLKRRLVRSREAMAALDSLDPAPDVVLVYGGGAEYLGTITRWAKKRRLVIAADVVEWYDASHQPLGRFGPYAWDNHLMMTRTLRRMDGAIVISRFLERHLKSLGVTRLVRVPPLADIRRRNAAATAAGGPLRIAYCGTPGRKDRLDLVIRAMAAVDPQGDSVRLDVAGVDSQQLKDLYGFDELPASVTAWGRVPHARALDILSKADFMPLIRDDERFAQAGFPTKVVEALSLGVVPWVNLTSDLGDHLTDGANAVIVPGSDLGAVIESLTALSTLSREQVEVLSEGAATTAERFTIESAIPELDRWASQVKGLGAL